MALKQARFTGGTMNFMPTRQPLQDESPPQQLAVLLTLVAGNQPATDPCPAQEGLIDLLEGRLAAGQRTLLLEHLDRCSACYRAWLGAAAQRPSQSVGRLHVIRRFSYFSALGSLALAAGLVLMLVRWDPFGPDLSGLLTAAYQTALHQGVQHAPDQPMPLPLASQGEDTTLSFSSPEAPMPVRQAFATGASAGWAALTGQEGGTPVPHTEQNWTVYHELGRWTILLQSLCTSTPPPAMLLLQQQTAIGEAMGGVLAKRAAAGESEARIPNQEVALINQLLHTPVSEEPAARLCRQIKKSCATIAESFLL